MNKKKCKDFGKSYVWKKECTDCKDYNECIINAYPTVKMPRDDKN